MLSTSEIGDLPDVIDKSCKGQIVISAVALNASELLPALSDRQAEIMVALLAGLSNKQIARRLLVSEITIKRDLALIYKAVGAQGRAELVDVALRLGFNEEPRSSGSNGTRLPKAKTAGVGASDW